jgi:hypothetical protein
MKLNSVENLHALAHTLEELNSFNEIIFCHEFLLENNVSASQMCNLRWVLYFIFIFIFMIARWCFHVYFILFYASIFMHFVHDERESNMTIAENTWNLCTSYWIFPQSLSFCSLAHEAVSQRHDYITT